MKKRKKDEPTKHLLVYAKDHRALKVEAARRGMRMLELATEKLRASSAA